MRIVFIGTGAIAVPVVRMLRERHDLIGVVTQPDRPAGRNLRLRMSPIKTVLEDSPLKILQPAQIKNEEAIGQIRALSPDVIVVMAYGQILPRAVLEIPHLACLNLHASLLPRWRGAAPIQAAIAAGDTETGITVMYMDEGLDTGDILLERKMEIAPDETGGSLHDRLARIAPEVLSDAIDVLQKKKAPRVPQDNARATYAPKLERENGRIDSSKSAEVIEREIRAFNPWPGAFTIVNGRNLKIFRAKMGDDIDGPFAIKARDGSIIPLEVQLEGSRRMSAEEFRRGHPGMRLAQGSG